MVAAKRLVSITGSGVVHRYSRPEERDPMLTLPKPFVIFLLAAN